MNSARVVIDASVFVASIQPQERYHADGRLLLERLTKQKVEICVPALVLAEIAAAIARGTTDSGKAEKDVALIQEVPGLQIITIDQELGILAARIAARRFIRGCDAVYVALSMTLDVPLITLDRQQREQTPNMIIALTPGEALTVI
ncbi:MAG: type II toxin-antitoxin system VapC family toxin [Caldilineales bacterium]|nr:type II toxin-antitoxin system VapC family toxin [Caldilineales bacterium]